MAVRQGKTGYTSTTTGFWLGNDSGTPKFHIGTSSNFLKFDGSALNIAGSLTATNLTIDANATINGTLDASVIRLDGQDLSNLLAYGTVTGQTGNFFKINNQLDLEGRFYWDANNNTNYWDLGNGSEDSVSLYVKAEAPIVFQDGGSALGTFELNFGDDINNDDSHDDYISLVADWTNAKQGTGDVTKFIIKGRSNDLNSAPKQTIASFEFSSGDGFGIAKTVFNGLIETPIAVIEDYIKIEQDTAPSSTTDKLYNVGGTLYWNGAVVDTGAGDITAVNITTSTQGGLTGGANFSSGDATFTLALAGSIPGSRTFEDDIVIEGDLTVQGATTSLEVATLNVEDKNITLNYGSGNTSGSANGSGITIQDAVSQGNDATILWNTSANAFKFSHDIRLDDAIRLEIGDSSDLRLYHNADSDSLIENTTNNLVLRNTANDKDIVLQTDNGSGGFVAYLRADGSTGETKLYNYGSLRLVTASDGIDVQGTTNGTFGLNIIDPTATNYGAHFSFDDADTKIKIGGVTNGTKNSAITIERDTSHVTIASSLDVSGNIEVGDSHLIGDDSFDNLALVSGSGENIVVGANNDIYFTTGATNLTSTGNTKLIVKNGGNIGISTTDPQKPLHVYNATIDYVARFESGDNQGGIELKDATSTSSLKTQNGSLQLIADSFNDVASSSIVFRLDALNSGEIATLNSTGLSVEGTGTFNTQVFLPKQGTATSSSNQFESATLVFQASGWDTNGSHNTDGSWTIKNVPVASNYPDYDLNFYEEGNQLKFQLHGRGTSNHVDPLSATFHGNVNIKPDSSGGTNAGAGNLQINNTEVISSLRALNNISGITLDNNSSIDFPSLSNGNINLGRSGRITLYGDDSSHHSIASRNQAGDSADDITINTYGALYIDLDSNNNNTSGADFRIGRHSANTGTDSYLFNVSGETGYVGISTSTPTHKLTVAGTTSHETARVLTTTGNANLRVSTDNSDFAIIGQGGSNRFDIYDNNASATRLSLDASGNLLVGKTNTTFGDAGIEARENGNFRAIRDGANVGDFNRLTSDGNIVAFYKDNTTVGSIGTNSGYIRIGTGDTHLLYHSGIDTIIPYSGSANRDNAISLGYSGARFKDLYLSGSVIAGSTSGASVQLNPSGSIELCRTAGNSDPFIDFKDSSSDDYDARIRMDNNSLFFSVGGFGNITTPLVLNATGEVDLFRNLDIDTTNPQLTFRPDDGILFRLRVDESANRLEIGHSSNKNLYLSNTGDATFNYDLNVASNLTVQGTLSAGTIAPDSVNTDTLNTESIIFDSSSTNIATQNARTTTTSSTSQTAIISMGLFTSVKFQVQITDSTTSSFHVTEIMVLNDGTNQYISEYGTITTGSALATFDADKTATNLRLLATPTTSNTLEYKIIYQAIYS